MTYILRLYLKSFKKNNLNDLIRINKIIEIIVAKINPELASKLNYEDVMALRKIWISSIKYNWEGG